jgi:tetratricopeptide (TPR) repeat protein
MPRYLIAILLFLLNLLAAGQIPFNVQQKTIDSLLTRLKTSGDTAYVNTLNDLSVNLADRNFDSAYSYAQQALVQARQFKYSKGEGVACMNAGHCYFVKMDIKAALEQYFTALRILEPLGPSRDLVYLYFQMRYINGLVPHNDRAIDFFQKALKTSLITGDPPWGSHGACFELANYYWQSSWDADQPLFDRTLDSAYKYCLRSFELLPYDSARNLDYQVDILTTKGNILAWQGDKNSYEPLYQALQKALELKRTRACSPEWKEMNDTTAYDLYIGFAYGNLSEYYMSIDRDLDRAEECLNQSLSYNLKTPHFETVAATLDGLGLIAKERKQYSKAIEYFKESVALCDTFLNDGNRRKHCPSWTRIRYILHTQDRQIFNYNILSDIYQEAGDFRNALEYQRMAEKQRRKKMKTDFEHQIDLLQTNYENDNTDQKITFLNSENELNLMRLSRTRGLLIGTGIVAALLVLVVVLYFQRKKLKTEQKALVLEQKLLRSQMNPHFIFNSLSSIQNFIVTEKPDKASIYLSKFSRLVRNILDNSLEEFVSLDREISTIENYLELQKVRYAGKFDYRIDVADEIDPETMKIPPMLAQPFIENAIEHGIKHRETPGKINIRFTLKENTLIFEVEDDGVGRQKAREIEIIQDPGHRSMATSLTRERLANLNRKLHKKIELEIIDLKNALGEAVGTRVVFGVPVR